MKLLLAKVDAAVAVGAVSVSLSTIVTVAVVGVPSVKLKDGFVSVKLNDSFPSIAVSSRIGTVKDLLVWFDPKSNSPLVRV